MSSFLIAGDVIIHNDHDMRNPVSPLAAILIEQSAAQRTKIEANLRIGLVDIVIGVEGKEVTSHPPHVRDHVTFTSQITCGRPSSHMPEDRVTITLGGSVICRTLKLFCIGLLRFALDREYHATPCVCSTRYSS